MQEEFNNLEEQVQEEAVQEEYVQPEGGEYENPYATNTQPLAPAPKSNLIPGLVGAFLGSLIGAVLWVIIYNFGFIAGLAGAVTAVCAMKGYALFGKTLDKKGVICSAIIVVITIFLANKLAWSWEIFDVYTNEYGYDMTFFDAFIASDEIIAYSELTGDYYKDLIIGYGLTILASYKDIINAFKSAN